MDAGNSSVSMDSTSGSALVGTQPSAVFGRSNAESVGDGISDDGGRNSSAQKIQSGELETVRPARMRF